MTTRKELAQAIAMLRAEFAEMPVFDQVRVDMWMAALGKYPDGVVLAAATRHITACKWKPQLADIVELCNAQVGGCWLGADEAWALMPKSESESAMLTSEMAQALAESSGAGDIVAQRMAFKDAYGRLVEKAKIEGRSPCWFPSFGDDKVGAVNMLARAVQMGLVPIERAIEYRPEHATEIVKMAGITNHPLLAAPSEKGKAAVKALLADLRALK